MSKLILTRRVNETLVVSDRETKEILAKFTVHDIKGKHARLMVEADESIGVDRLEIYNQKKAEMEGKVV